MSCFEQGDTGRTFNQVRTPFPELCVLGGGGEKNAHRVLLMTASSQRGGILERHYVFGPMDMQPAAYQYGFFKFQSVDRYDCAMRNCVGYCYAGRPCIGRDQYSCVIYAYGHRLGKFN